MATANTGSGGGTFLPPTYADEKLAQRGGQPSPASSLKRIPAEFVDTPRLQRSTVMATYALSSPSKPQPASATLPVTLSGGGSLSASAPVTHPGGGVASSTRVYEYVSERPQSILRTHYAAPKNITSAMPAPEFHFSHAPPEVTYIEHVKGQYTSCPLELHSNSTAGHCLLDSPPSEATTTVTRYRLPRTAMPKVLPMKEMDYCTEAQQGRSRPGPQPSVTRYIIPSTGKLAKRRNVIMGRRRGICQDWVLPCLDTLFTAISRACNCDVDIVPQTEYTPSTGYMYMPDNGDAICLRCGETVNSRMASGMPFSYKKTKPHLTTTKKEPGTDDRIPLPVFAYNAFSEEYAPVEARESSDPASRAAQVGKRRSSALGYPTDDDGLVALPKFILGESK